MKKNQANYFQLTVTVSNRKKIIYTIVLSLIIICLLSVKTSFGQQTFYTIKGKVVDKNTKASLQGASVFAQNTTFGVATDAEGNFSIKLPNGGYSLVVTFTGYETESVRVSNTSGENNDLSIEIGPKEKSLEEVSIAVSNEVKDGWEKYGVFFIQNFIGLTKFSGQTIIRNPEALHFYFSKK